MRARGQIGVDVKPLRRLVLRRHRPGAYRFAGDPHIVVQAVVDDRSARLADGTLAGSVLTMDVAVRNAATLSWGAAGALAAASEVPARALGLADRGRLAAGLRADVVCWDADLRVVAAYVAGERAA